MEKNKSLSARIKRRNACGFSGEGTDSGWRKTSPWGDYRDNPIKRASKALEAGKNSQRGYRKRDKGPSLQQIMMQKGLLG